MPLTIPTNETSAISLEDLVEHLHAEKIDPSDQDALAAAAPMLKRLANNPDFLVERVVQELKDIDTLQDENSYSAQVFMLHAPSRAGQLFFIRACFWPSEQEQLVKVSGTDPFFYFRPHDHNFNFLTVGYSGPGYWSDYYEYDYAATTGLKGEAVDLKFIERSRLETGKVMLYRAINDVHDHLPADSFSGSINIMENTLRPQHMDQYGFNTRTSTITKMVNRIGAPALFDAISYCGSDEDREVVAALALRHPHERTRCHAWQALSNSAATPEGAIEVLRRVPVDSPSLVKGWSRQRIAEIEAAMAGVGG
jgi:hypothetical protein